jgi:hypothetical protein
MDYVDLGELNLEQAAAFRALGLLPSWALPSIAVRALEHGSDSPGLRLLAGETEPIESTVGPIFARALAELAVSIPDARTALMFVARYYAEKIVDGSISPYKGAAAIWRQVTNHSSAQGNSELWDSLGVFVGLASEHEDYPPARAELDEEIVREAQELLASSAGEASGDASSAGG